MWEISDCTVWSEITKDKELILKICLSHWPCGLLRRSAAALLLGSQVRVPLRAWIFVSCVCCVLCM